MSSRRWVVDASPVIVLAEAGHAELLAELASELVVPEAVRKEVSRGEENDAARRWLRGEGRAFVQPADTVAAIASWDLGPGESATLSWAKQRASWEAIVDDRAARRCAQALNVEVRGTLGVLLLAKREGAVSHVRPLLEDVVAAGLYVSDTLFQTVLRLADEE